MLKKHLLLLSMLKAVLLNIFCGYCDTFFKDSLMNIIFDQFNASLLNKNIEFC